MGVERPFAHGVTLDRDKFGSVLLQGPVLSTHSCSGDTYAERWRTVSEVPQITGCSARREGLTLSWRASGAPQKPMRPGNCVTRWGDDMAMRLLPPGPSFRAPLVRPAYRLLKGSYSTVAGLLDAVPVLDAARRSGNDTTRGRMSRTEVDVLRAAIIMTSAGVDATMRRLVSDAAGAMIRVPGTAANITFSVYIKKTLSSGSVPESLKDAIVSSDPTSSILAFYLAERTRSSYQGSGDLRVRVKRVLGVSDQDVADTRLSSLDLFFQARNAIAHDLDYISTSTHSIKRAHRTVDVTADMCSQVFEVAAELITGTGIALVKAGC